MIAVQPFNETKSWKFDCLTLPHCDKEKSSANVADAIFLEINFTEH
jgi:hypothetical protein